MRLFEISVCLKDAARLVKQTLRATSLSPVRRADAIFGRSCVDCILKKKIQKLDGQLLKQNDRTSHPAAVAIVWESISIEWSNNILRVFSIDRTLRGSTSKNSNKWNEIEIEMLGISDQL